MIGIDIVEVSRIKTALKKENFLTRILTINEIDYVNTYKDKDSHIAGFFSAKEAVMKALKDCKNISFLDIEIFHEKTGAPYVKLYGKAKEVFDKMAKKNIQISISQTKNYATAMCVIN